MSEQEDSWLEKKPGTGHSGPEEGRGAPAGSEDQGNTASTPFPSAYGASARGPVAPYSPKPNNFLAWAVLSTLLCCVPLGVASIVFAAQVDSKWAVGDFQGAAESSRRAKNFAVASAAVTLALLVLYLLFGLVAYTLDPQAQTYDYDYS